jgi:uracil phosphoribosyltransferase
MTGLHIPDHPVVADRLMRMRDKLTSPSDFRTALKSLAPFLVYEAARGLETETVEVETPCGTAKGRKLHLPVVLFPVLRAGLGLLEGALDVFPEARVGFIGAYRDEKTFQPVEYHRSGPRDLKGAAVFVLDPMLATGGSAVFAIAKVKEMGASAIRLVSVIAAPDGVDKVRAAHPDVPIIAAAVDPGLNEKMYIVPGLGDAGDRFFGT